MAARRLFEAGAGLYAWYTENATWTASCAALADHLPSRPMRLLDLGCGPGTTLQALQRRLPGAALAGGDLAGRMLTQARRRLRQGGIVVSLLQLDARHLPFADQSFDAVTGHSFLYLVDDARAVLDEVRRVLRPGGRAAFMEPATRYVSPRALWRFSHDARFLMSVLLWRVMSRRHRRFDVATLPETLAAAGLIDLRAAAVLGGLGVIGSGARPADA